MKPCKYFPSLVCLPDAIQPSRAVEEVFSQYFGQYFGQLNQEEISHDSGHRKMKITLIAAGTT